MKNIYILLIAIALVWCSQLSAQVSVTTDGSAADPSAMLDVKSTTGGVLFPRMTTAQRDAIASPAHSLVIFNTTTGCLQAYNAPNTSWENIYCVTPCTPPGAAGSISGTSAVCTNQTGVSYSVPAISGATGYVWSYSGTGFSIASGANTNSITADFASATAGNLTVYGTNACGNGTVSANYAITITAVPTGVSASASPNPVCEGSNLTLTGSATDATSWSWTGPNSYTSSLQSPTITGITTAGAGVYTLTASNTCGSAAPVSTASVTVSEAPTTANAGTDINPACDATTATLAGNTPTVGTGAWTVVSGTATITTPSSPTSGVTGLAVPGTATLRWTISNSPCTPSTDDVVITTTTCFTPGCGTGTTVVDVTNPSTGKTWMDRNLGASQVATSSTDYNAYGALFQWGRLSDGHECITWTSSTTSDGEEQNHETSTLSSTDNPGHSNFILAPNSPYDWRSPQNNNLWQGVSGINNPCPSSYRLPTEAELNAERTSWGTNNAAGAFASPLKLPVAGYRLYSNGSLSNVGSYGNYWSSTVVGTYSRYLYFFSSNAYMSSSSRANGFSVRCIKD
jgi:uncharacterized protein (TIGR02145 family)